MEHLIKQLDRIEAKVDKINGSVGRHETDIALLKQENAQIKAEQLDHETRVRKSEVAIWKLITIIAATSGTSAILTKLFL